MRKDKVVSEVLGEETAITPSDLYNTDFKTAMMGGYDKAEVDAFLERVADAYEAVLNQVRDLKELHEEQRAQVDAFHEMENTLRNALISSQKFSETMLDAARREAAAVMEEARLANVRAQIQAAKLPAALRQEITRLKDARDRLRADLRSMLETHYQLVENIARAEAETEGESAPPAADAANEEPWLDEAETNA